MSRWRPGDTVLLRYFERGRPAGALPTRLISTDGPVLWLGRGTPVMWPALDGRPVREIAPEERYARRWEAVERPWTGEGVLIVGRPGRAHAIWLFSDAERFAGWYVNLEDAWRPSHFGFDTADHELDLWIESDGSWRWKDEYDLDVAVERGHYTPEQATAFREEGERVIAEWPLPTGWEEWRPDPSWPVPSVPADWHTWSAADRPAHSRPMSFQAGARLTSETHYEGGAMSTSRKIFVNLAVDDLARSVEFFTNLGFTFDPRFTDETATCMVVSDEAFVMLLTQPRFKDFTKKEVADATTQTEAILAVSADSRHAVDDFADKALAAGASPANDPIEMGDFMYGRSFNDPDGHLWEVIWMDPSALEQQPVATETAAAS